MTTIVALHVPGKGTHYGCESMATGNGRKGFTSESKWATYGDYAVGVSGLLSTVVLVKQFAKELLEDLDGPFEFGQRMLELAHAHKWLLPAPDEEGGPPTMPASLLLASPEGVWELDPSMAYVDNEVNRLHSAGSGSQFALGAGYALRHLPPAKRVQGALEAACTFDLYSGGEIRTGFLPLPRTKARS